MFDLHAVDCLDYTQSLADDSVDLVLGSPPYTNRRSYGIGFNLVGQDWVDWAVARFIDQVRICKGLVCWVVDGPTKNFRWTATPALLMADLHRAGIKLRKPPIFHRVGIPGSGGTDWWRNDYEFCICASKGKLPWSDNTATGKAPKYGVGGTPTHRSRSGRRARTAKAILPGKANPGNVIHCKVGGGHLGSKLAHENEAPYPESLAEPFVRSFCPPNGIVFDPFCGSGTTGAVALKHGRHFVGTDIRPEQCDLSLRRICNGDGNSSYATAIAV